jgi:hypothetical protein
MSWTRSPALAAACALALGACGGAKEGPESNDKRDVALDCLTGEKGLQAKAVGEEEIQVGDDRSGPKVRFFITRGVAEAEQFEGRAEGTLQSGSALIYVRRSPDDLLAKVEDCIDNL